MMPMGMNVKRETTFTTGKLTLANLRLIVSATDKVSGAAEVRVRQYDDPRDGTQSTTITVLGA